MFRLCLAISLFFSSLQAQPLYERLVLDHVNIAVKNLPAAVAFFEDTLGFVVKPGRLHKNSIENAHIKFKDGSSIELITASEPRDALAKFYLQRLEKYPLGSAAFICLRITDDGAVDSLLNMFPLVKSDFGYADLYSFKPDDPRYPLFFIRYKKPVKDDPKYLYHWNGAESLLQVMICKNWWKEHFLLLGNVVASSVMFTDKTGEIYLSEDKLMGIACSESPIAGVSLFTTDKKKTKQYLSGKGVEDATFGSLALYFISK